MRKTLAVAYLNFKGAVKDNFFLGVAFFFAFYLAFCIFLGKLSAGQMSKVLSDAGLFGIEVTVITLIIFSFTMNFYRERDTRILEVYLSRFDRASYVSGKILGYCLLSLVYLVFCAVCFSAILGAYGGFAWPLLAALYPVFLKSALIIGFVSIFSCFLSSATTAMLTTFFVWIASEFAPSAVIITEQQGLPWQKAFIKGIYLLLPNVDRLNVKSAAVYGQLPGAQYFILATLYAGAYLTALWLINILILREKEY